MESLFIDITSSGFLLSNFTNQCMYDNYNFKPCLAKIKIVFFYMVIVISIHQMADKSDYWKQAPQTTQFGAILPAAHWSSRLTEMVLLFDQLLKPLKSLRNPPDLVCSRNDYILWYKFQKFKKCWIFLGYALSIISTNPRTNPWNFNEKIMNSLNKMKSAF